MPAKRDPYRSYGQKIISLFARLLFSREEYSLSELARLLDCSKQTVLRLLEDLRRSYKVDLQEWKDGNRKYVRIPAWPAGKPPAVPLTEMELNLLLMCRNFAAHLLGKDLFEEAAQALWKNQALPGDGKKADRSFAVFRPGTIDYTPHQAVLRAVLQALDKRMILKLAYQGAEPDQSKTFFIKPLKLFSYRDTVYLHVRLAGAPGRPSREREIDLLLAIHRIQSAEMTGETFDFPADYDFDAVFNREFGVIKGEAFTVEVEFAGWAARHAAERFWSPGQKIVRVDGDTVRITFKASSDWEVLSSVLFYRASARLHRPKRLVRELRRILEKLRETYTDPTES